PALARRPPSAPSPPSPSHPPFPNLKRTSFPHGEPDALDSRGLKSRPGAVVVERRRTRRCLLPGVCLRWSANLVGTGRPAAMRQNRETPPSSGLTLRLQFVCEPRRRDRLPEEA